jgi:hypothetical protein
MKGVSNQLSVVSRRLPVVEQQRSITSSGTTNSVLLRHFLISDDKSTDKESPRSKESPMSNVESPTSYVQPSEVKLQPVTTQANPADVGLWTLDIGLNARKEIQNDLLPMQRQIRRMALAPEVQQRPSARRLRRRLQKLATLQRSHRPHQVVNQSPGPKTMTTLLSTPSLRPASGVLSTPSLRPASGALSTPSLRPASGVLSTPSWDQPLDSRLSTRSR